MKLMTAVRGYGGTHQAYRRMLAPIVAAGLYTCPYCEQLIVPGEEWHLGHEDGSGKRRYIGPTHARCNLEAGGRDGAAKRFGGKRSRRW